jgi:signal transduction histidine kinase
MCGISFGDLALDRVGLNAAAGHSAPHSCPVVTSRFGDNVRIIQGMPHVPQERIATHADAEPEPRVDATFRSVMRPTVVCVSGPDIGKAFQLGLGDTVIGRGSVDISLTETDISRRHARLTFRGAGIELEDLGSSNGTELNGIRITGSVTVRAGDRIAIGRTVLVFSQHDELEQRVQRMQRLEAMATLAGGIAHDFNNSLAVILCNLEVVAAALPADAADGREAVAEMEAAATSAASLAKRLLRLGRTEPIPFALVALEPLVARTAAMARRRTHSPVALVIDVPRDLAVLGSCDELQQVVLNLCLNACDAMPEGGQLTITGGHVKVNAEDALASQLPKPGTYVELAVTDTGCGMDAATLARAFEPFFTTKPRDRGTGLGLAMIHSSVRRHGGAIDVQSVVGRGTTFRLRLPRGG